MVTLTVSIPEPSSVTLTTIVTFVNFAANCCYVLFLLLLFPLLSMYLLFYFNLEGGQLIIVHMAYHHIVISIDVGEKL